VSIQGNPLLTSSADRFAVERGADPPPVPLVTSEKKVPEMFQLQVATLSLGDNALPESA
jgi:hypothetical protein